MTSFQTYPIAEIWFDRTTRQRRDLGDLSDLAESISKIGLLNPIIITREGELIAGERRLAAMKQLGWTHALVQFREDLTDLEREQIELDENIRRLDLPWQDKALAMFRYHELCLTIESPEWTMEQTADRLGIARRTLAYNLAVAQALRAGDQRVTEAPKFSTAVGILERQEARRQNLEEDAVEALLKPPPNGDEPPAAPSTPPLVPIYQGDFASWAATPTSPKFNLIHCDFPYGITHTTSDYGITTRSFETNYDDTPKVYWALIETLEKTMDHLVAPAAHLIFWFSMNHYIETFNRLSYMGWQVQPAPLVWVRSTGGGICPDPRRQPTRIYETAFLCSRGDRFIVNPRQNAYFSPNSKTWHMSEKPLPVLTHFLSMLVDDTTRMLDPTCGSGNACIAAHQLGAKSVLGLELNPEFHANAVRNWKEQVDG